MMNGYVPNYPVILAAILIGLVVEVSLGFLITRLTSRTIARISAWMLVLVSVSGMERLTASEPAGLRMLALIAALLYAMKAVVSVEEHAAGREKLKPGCWFLFTLGWPGMRPSTFADVPGPSKDRWGELLKQGGRNLAGGIVLFFLAWGIGTSSETNLSAPTRLWLATALLLPAISLVMHFGVFDLVAGGWRIAGANCHALFRAPLRSTNLTEFWGRRWNLAFSEMTTLTIFRPLKPVIGPRAAMLGAFLFSGLLHETAISVPVQAGFGLPFLYFVLHAVAMQIEAALSRRGHPIDAYPSLGRLWTITWIVLPLPILFHRPFLRGCVWPLIGIEDLG